MIAERIELALNEVLPFAIEDVDGGRRGLSSTRLAALEVLGDGPSEATLFVEVPKDDPIAVAQNAALLVQFLQAAIPEWVSSQKWLNEQLESKSAEVKFAKFRHEVVLRKRDGGVFLAVYFPKN